MRGQVLCESKSGTAAGSSCLTDGAWGSGSNVAWVRATRVGIHLYKPGPECTKEDGLPGLMASGYPAIGSNGFDLQHLIPRTCARACMCACARSGWMGGCVDGGWSHVHTCARTSTHAFCLYICMHTYACIRMHAYAYESLDIIRRPWYTCRLCCIVDFYGGCREFYLGEGEGILLAVLVR